MKRSIVFMILGFLLMIQGPSALAEGEGRSFEVTITNLTRGQQFTPILVASHEKGVKLFTLGDPASPQLATLAEAGATADLDSLLSGMSEVGEVKTSMGLPMGLLDPGASVTVMVYAGGRFNHVSVASMLIPTNDGFFAINGVKGPKEGKTLTLVSPAYDAGSEVNDELCVSIPGPFFDECGGAGGGGAPGGCWAWRSVWRCA